jgi:hypothetical protein
MTLKEGFPIFEYVLEVSDRKIALIEPDLLSFVIMV